MTSLEYLAHRRRIIFLDEWRYYAVIAALWFSGNQVLFAIVSLYGAFCLIVSYRAYWNLEAQLLYAKESAPTNGSTDEVCGDD